MEGACVCLSVGLCVFVLMKLKKAWKCRPYFLNAFILTKIYFQIIEDESVQNYIYRLQLAGEISAAQVIVRDPHVNQKRPPYARLRPRTAH
jgi:hypothetical protein